MVITLIGFVLIMQALKQIFGRLWQFCSVVCGEFVRSFVAILFGRLWKFADPSPRQASICGLTSSLIVN